MICGFNYESIAYVQGLRIIIFIGDLSLIVFLVKQISKSIKFKTPLIIAIVAKGLDVIRLGILFYMVYIQNQETYSYKSLEVCGSIIRILFYGYNGIMVISFILLFIVSQRTKSKK